MNKSTLLNRVMRKRGKNTLKILLHTPFENNITVLQKRDFQEDKQKEESITTETLPRSGGEYFKGFSGKTDRLKSKKIDRRLYFSTTNGSLLEFTEGQTLR